MRFNDFVDAPGLSHPAMYHAGLDAAILAVFPAGQQCSRLETATSPRPCGPRREERARLVPAAPASLAASSAVSATVASGGLGTSFVDDERASQQILAIQARNGFFGCDSVTDFYKGKSARLAGIAIADDRDRIGVDSEVGKFRADILFRDAERKIPYVEFLHRPSPYRLLGSSTPESNGILESQRIVL